MATTLLAAFQARYSSWMATNVTNPDNADATTTNTTLINTYITDVVADFDLYAQVQLDPLDVDPRWVGVASKGLLVKLRMASGTNTDQKEAKEYYDGLIRIFENTPREMMVDKVNVDKYAQVLDDRKKRQINQEPALYVFGQAACSGLIVTGTGTRWADSKLVFPNCAIAFGYKDPVLFQDDDWYLIGTVDSNTQLTLQSSAGTVTSGDYVIQLADERNQHA